MFLLPNFFAESRYFCERPVCKNIEFLQKKFRLSAKLLVPPSPTATLRNNREPCCVAELEPVRQSGSGPTGPDKTGRKIHPAGRNRIFAGFLSIFLPDFLPDFCRIFVSVTSKMNRTEFTGFFSIFLPDFCRIDLKNDPAGFLPDFCQIGIKNDPAGFRPDRTGQILKLAGPDRMQNIRPVPTLVCRIDVSLYCKRIGALKNLFKFCKSCDT